MITDEIIPILENAVKKNGLAGLIDLHTAFLDDVDLLADDGIHPTQEGARKMAAIIAKTIDPAARTEPRGFWMQ